MDWRKGGSLSGTLKDRERVTIDQDRCRSATHSLQQSHVDNIPPLSTASDARSSPLRAFSCPALASKPHGRARPLWRPSGAPAAASARGPWRGSARRPRAPGARGRLHVLPCADEIGSPQNSEKSYAKVFRASVRAETSRLPVCGSAARRNRRLG